MDPEEVTEVKDVSPWRGERASHWRENVSWSRHTDSYSEGDSKSNSDDSFDYDGDHRISLKPTGRSHSDKTHSGDELDEE